MSREDIAKGQIKFLKKAIERILTSAPYPMEKNRFVKYVNKHLAKACPQCFFYGIPSEDAYVIEERELLRNDHSVVYCELDAWLTFRCGKLVLYRRAVVRLLEIDHVYEVVLEVEPVRKKRVELEKREYLKASSRA